ncbi:MAG: hypothetical protein FWF90_15645 [Promicromonosporaceae bacterium]|nr:hypothetical protein [Promicromonosporaceae bacterium]
MTAVPLTNLVRMRDATLTLGTDNYEAAVVSGAITPSFSSVDLIDGSSVDDVTWVLDINHVQDSDAGGLTRYLFDQAGQLVPFTLTLSTGADPISGTVRVRPFAAGGARGVAQSSGSLPIVGTPTWAVVGP